MIIQEATRASREGVWVSFTNRAGATITRHQGVFKFLSTRNAASVDVNEGATQAVAANTALGTTLLGLADEDVANNATGLCQVYGYHESVMVYRIVDSVTVTAGDAIGPGAAASVGFSSTGTKTAFGPLISLAGITAAVHSLGTVGNAFADHVFIRCM